MTKTEFIARVRYLGWICFQMGANLELHDVPENYEISKERLEGLMQGTEWTLRNPDATPKDNHANWIKSKSEQGYVYGEHLDIVKKTHPSMVPFEQLPDIEKRKDEMDLLMVKLATELFNGLED